MPELKQENLALAKETFELSVDLLTNRIKELIQKKRDLTFENAELQDKIKALKSDITELKLEITKLNSDLILKEKELAEKRNVIIESRSDSSSENDRERIRSQIKDLISRIDVHIAGQNPDQGVNEENI
ncbi:MAG: hypothetical protein UZ04_CHB001001421 [Chlorobi bacterium OLB4]|jgi:chromosome segregation ATPase|nr:MAG: hypothetical protein EDM69_09355 [Chlorobiota bacterium]KXK03463.1 MAG: hypothetical protein UZ04_CHB001001421 [Chlorobi bacterium OLB4]MBV6398974.1 hypothetical protein [Ignavibacteria bacterium]MCE7953882.1 hypothetical protein [Chlorobi bacterium CHB7]OQY77106.1 MAG: hypothetical protein B6D43_08325 [Ignavibacteriales bacterium UTCHB1]RIK47775.1 MAG: hypothetical protein DCC60_09385 [Ignavibacteriota bacterium]